MQPSVPIRKRFESSLGKLGLLGLKPREPLLQLGNLLLDAVAVRPFRRGEFGLFGIDLPGDFTHPLAGVLAVRRREKHAILRKPFEGIVGEIR